VNKLEKWGVIALPTIEKELACGEKGLGALMEPEDIADIIK